MSVNFYLCSINPISYNHPKTGLHASGTKFRTQSNPTFSLPPDSPCRRYKCRSFQKISSGIVRRKRNDCFRKFASTKAVKTDNDEVSSFTEEEIAIDFDCTDGEDEGAPWEGAILYRRNSSITHVEYCTTLERLGLSKLSSELSRSRASAMGLRVTKVVKDYLDGTPVLVSVDVTRRKQKLRLDGIIKTVITLACYRCGEPAAESVFADFSLLLTEDPIEEPEVLNLGTIYAEDRSRGTVEDEEALIDLDDKLYFPPERKEIDISKHIRDMVHLEITINAICNPKCKGLCLKCGTNLNTSVCNCGEEDEDDMSYGPLGELRKQMQHK